MRKLLVFGFLSAYISLPFATIPGSVPGAGAKVANLVSQNKDVTVLVEKTKGSLATASIVDVVSFAVKRAMPVTKQVTSSLLSRASLRDLEDAIQNQTDPAKKAVLERVSFAAKKGDIDLCAEQERFLGAGEKLGMDTGDLLAFCSAAVMSEKLRCEQIEDASLRSLCDAVFQRES